MIHLNTIIKVGDNSGAKFVKCINTSKGKKNSARLGDIIKVSIYKNDNSKKIIKKNKVYKALVVNCTQKRSISRNGVYFKWNRNRVLMLSETLKFLGTRVYGSISKEIKKKSRKKEGTFRSSIVSYCHGFA
jgi:large subunit ribosomal protein L14